MQSSEAGSYGRILAASLAGTAIEFYDFFIYGTAASLVFGKLFFAAAPPSAQLLAAYASFGVAFVARPIGALAFGHFGDRVGRKSTLIASLLLMGVSTVAIGVVPTYSDIGWPAPVLLCLLRFGQGLGLGGEWGGAALLAMENAPPAFRGRFGMFPQLGAPVGFLAANGFFLLLGLALTPAQFLAWGWRLPFLASAALVALGLWVRMRLTETPVFAAALAEAPPPRVPAATLLRDFPRETLAGTFAVVAAFAIFYLTTTFALGYATTALGYDRREFLAVLLAAIPFLAAGILCSGHWSDRTDPRRVLIIGCGVAVPLGLLLAPLLASGSLAATWLFLSIALFVMGLVYGPLGAWMPSLFPPRVRYTGVSVAFTVGGILGGGIAPFVAQSLASRGGLPWVGFYLSVAALVSLIALLTLGRSPREQSARVPSTQTRGPALPVTITYHGNHVALVTIDRPEVRNAVNPAVAAGLELAIAWTEADPDIWAVVLTGAGSRAFSAGADLAEVSRGNLSALWTKKGGFAGFVHATRTKPWIAAVEGLALAGGCEIALACDLVVASEGAAFGLPEVTRGLVASAGGLYRLARAIPRAIAMEMIVTGKRLSASRAAALGLVNELAPDGCAVERALALANSIVENAPLAVRESLAIARAAADFDDATLRAMSEAAQERLKKTEDFVEGPLAFIEKRDPRWKCR